MKKILLLFIISTMYSCVSKLTLREIRNSEPIIVYETTDDFINKKPMKVNARIIIDKGSKQHITVKKIFNSETEKVFNKWQWFWAINYEGENYFNLLYSKDLNRYNTFAKFSIEGDICAIIVDEDSPDMLKSIPTQGLGLYGSGTGIGISYTFLNKKQGNKKAIYIIETKILAPKFGARKPGSFAYYLGNKRLKDLIDENNIKTNYDKVKDIPSEKIIEIINTINKTK